MMVIHTQSLACDGCLRGCITCAQTPAAHAIDLVKVLRAMGSVHQDQIGWHLVERLTSRIAFLSHHAASLRAGGPMARVWAEGGKPGQKISGGLT